MTAVKNCKFELPMFGGNIMIIITIIDPDTRTPSRNSYGMNSRYEIIGAEIFCEK